MISIRNLTFSYRKKKNLFSNLNLEIQSGRIYGLLGKNGMGKTTLLHLVSGLLFPEAGEVKVLGENPANRSPRLLTEIYFLPEEMYTPPVSPVKYAGMFGSFYTGFDMNTFISYLNEFEIEASHNMSNMSMGQRKKSMIAFALACNVKVLLMDEPTNGLDIPSKTQFRKIIASLMTEDQTIIISTHQVRDLDNLIDSVVILDENHILFNQTTEEISQKLYFTMYRDSKELAEILYKEEGILGGRAILKNNSPDFSQIDMELLFNGILHNKKEITDLFIHSSKA